MRALAAEHDRQILPSGLYQKLMRESHKKVPHNIDIAPHISLTIMFIVVLWVVSLC